MNNNIIKIEKLGFQFPTDSPFVACMYHLDNYPKGNGNMGPDTSLAGRNIGEDFSCQDGFSMYHGETIPGFPAHPHRGFETVTIVTQGIVDHFDSKGAKGRYGNGDVQWLTTGKGCQHAEMFPLIHDDKENTLQLFQIWFNLHKTNKMVEPDYKMLWSEDIPVVKLQNNAVTIKLIAGKYQNTHSLTPTPASWAANPDNHVRIMLIEMQPHSQITLPAISDTLNRNLYFYQGNGSISIDDTIIDSFHRIKLTGNLNTIVSNGNEVSYLLLLEGEPINEPVVQHGPFVMNTVEEIQQAFRDFQATQFGGWPWAKYDQVNDKNAPRFAQYPNGNVETK